MSESGINSDIVLILVIGTMGMVILALGILFFFLTYQKRLQKQQLHLSRIKTEHQEKLLENTVVSQEKERKRFAADLHDEVGAMLSFIKLNLGRIQKKEGNSEITELATESKKHLDQVITQVRRITRDLSPPTLEKLGLVEAVNEFIGWVNKSDAIQIQLYIIGEKARFNPKYEVAVFRIIQELVNNSIKHSETPFISIKLKFNQDWMFLSVSDYGKGFDVEKATSKGLGLKNIESRTSIFKGRYKFKSKPGKGTSFILVAKIQ
ncbi:MAG: hypothetical protein HQ541_16345 [Mariniphaga sp.]|nr:hypothetical protein [Mariniphaga sp.]